MGRPQLSLAFLIAAAVGSYWSGVAAASVVPSSTNGFRVSPGPAIMEGTHAIAFDGEHFLAVWHTSAPFATRITPEGEVLDPEGIQLGSVADHVPSVAFDGTNFLAVWVAGSELFGARLAKEGALVDSPELHLASDAKPRRIAIAFDGTNYLIAWRTSSDAIRAARISTDGVNLDGASGFAVGTGFYPSVAYGGGVYLVVWHNWGPNGLDVFGARVGTDGTVLSPGVFPICTAEEYQDHASVSSNGSDFLAVWHDYRGGNDQNDGGTWGSRITAAGAVLDAPAIVIAPYSVGQTPPTVAFDGTDYIVAWQESINAKFRLLDAFARRVSFSGTLVDDEPIPLATSYGHQSSPTVGFGGDRYLAAWNEGSRCRGGCTYARLFKDAAEARRLTVLASSAPPRRSAGAAPIEAGWIRVTSPVTSALNAVAGSDDAHVYAVGEAPDGYDIPMLRFDGSTWSVWTVLPQRGRMYSIWGKDPNDIWVVGLCFAAAHYDGQSWGPPDCHGTGGITDPYVMAFGAWRNREDSLLIVGGEGGFIIFDETCWTSLTTGFPEDLWGLWGTTNQVYAPGEAGTILSYDNAVVPACAGVSGAWSRVPGVPTFQSLNAIWGSGPDDVFAVGDAGTIVHWDGASWTRHASGTTEHLTGVSGLSASDVYAVGLGGTILHYDGEAWAAEASGTTSALLGIACVGATVWAVGDYGEILKKPGPEISIADVIIKEGNRGQTTADFVVTLSRTSTGTISVRYATAGGTAMPSRDYAPVQGRLTFTPGVTSGMISVPVYGDRIDEDDETFQLQLSEPFAATIARASAVASIVDDDMASISIADSQVREGNASARQAILKVSLSLPTRRVLRVSYATADGTASAGADYSAVSGVLEFPPGCRTREIRISVLGDRQVEDDETFFVTLSNAEGAPISRSIARVVILNDDH